MSSPLPRRVLLPLLAVLVAPLLFESSAVINATVVRVDPDNGVNNASCLPPNPTIACRNIGYALSNKTNAVTYELKSGSNATHYLDNNGTDVFVNVDYVSLVSSNDSESVVVQCRNGAGLGFDGSSNVLIRNVQFLCCGALRNSTSMDFSQRDPLSLLTFKVTLYFYQCTNVTLDTVAVINSTDAAGVVMYDTVGTNTISHSNFSANPSTATNPNNFTTIGGGGFAVEFTYCSPGDNTCGFRSEMNHDATYVFNNCTFENNHAYSQRGNNFSSAFLYPVKEKHQAFGRGGGLSLYFQGNASNNRFYLKDCHFLHNHADWGGGLLIEFDDNSIQNTIEVQHTVFYHNHAVFANSFGTGGGAARIASYTNTLQESSELSGNTVTFTDHCNFTYNKAWNGGGISISLALQNMGSLQLTNITIENVIFEANQARLGSAVEVALFPMFRAGTLGRILLNHCSFYDNNIVKGFDNKKPYYSAGIGTVYSNEVSLSFNSSAYFENNIGTAVAIAGAMLHFENTLATFISNTGRTGGAIALLGAAHMVVSSHTNFLFLENNATEYGGAIYNRYIGLEDMQSYIACFIQYDVDLEPPENWGTHFTFCGNVAGLLGNSIFSTSILPCAWSSLKGIEEVQKIFRWERWNYCGRNDSEISSEQHSFNITESTTMQVFPGQTVKLDISAKNELQEDITSQTVYSAAINDSESVNVAVKPEYTYISGGYFAVTGEENNVTLGLHTFGSQNWHLDIKLNVLKCPPGMILRVSETNFNKVGSNNSNSGNSTASAVCSCISYMMFNNKVLCSTDPDDFTTRIQNSYWIGTLHPNSTDGELYVGECPYKYCHTNDKEDYITLPKNVENLETKLCKKQNRSGVLCGECIPGHSSAINSYQFPCVYCNSSNGTNIAKNVAIYLATSYLPIVVFLILIIFLNIRLTTGPVNAYILFAQVISVNFIDIPIVFDASHETNHRAYAFLYGIFNLNFFSHLLDPFCVNENFSSLDILLLQFAVAAFPLTMIVIVILVIRLKDCCSWKCDFRRRWRPLNTSNGNAQSGTQKMGVALVHALVAFMLLSYSKFCSASTLILTTTTVYDATGENEGLPRSYLAGQYSLSNPRYLLNYCLPSVIVFVCVAIPPLLLLGPLNWFNNCAANYRCLRRVWPQDKVHIILDTFQGCFKPKMRFYSGVYFLFRLALFICYAFTRDFFQQYVIQQIFLTLLVTMLALFQPYQKALLNYIDTLVITNLCIINALSVYVVSTESSEIPKLIFYIQYILVYIPIFCFLCYLTVLILNKSKLSLWLKLKAEVLVRLPKRDTSDLHPLITPSQYNQPAYESLSDDSVLLARANEPNTFRPAPLVQSDVEQTRTRSNSHSPNSDTLSSGIYSGKTTRSRSYDEQPTETSTINN